MNFDGLFNGGAPKEPSADLREAASGIRQLYVALMSEGFSEQEAMTIVLQTIASGGQ